MIIVLGIHNNVFYCKVSIPNRIPRLIYPFKESIYAPTSLPKQQTMNFDFLLLSFMLHYAMSSVCTKEEDDEAITT